ncbi:MAG: hypothetical protein IJQ81_08110 [Oscillibacter sp.]|nr:hypothetical protein [Oscillibacter sp.]
MALIHSDKTDANTKELFNLHATLRLDADEYIKTLDIATAKTEALIEKTERLAALLNTVSSKAASVPGAD